MLKSCKYCGKIHDSNFDCGKKLIRKKIRTKQNSFRGTQLWRRKSEEIRERDNYLCQLCIRELYGARRKYNSNNIEVHHIIPLADDYDRRLDNDNLISLCSEHHEMAERGEIPCDVLLEIALEQERKANEVPRGSE